MTDVAKEVMTTKVTSVVEIENTISATVRVVIENGFVTSALINYRSAPPSNPIIIKHDNSLGALIELRDQMTEVIEECQIYVDPRIVVDKDSPIAGELP